MSKKCRAQHSGPHRRHGDRNVQTRCSGKCRGQEITKNVQEESRMKDEKKKEGSKKDFVPVIIPEIKVKIHELHIHMDVAAVGAVAGGPHLLVVIHLGHGAAPVYHQALVRFVGRAGGTDVELLGRLALLELQHHFGEIRLAQQEARVVQALEIDVFGHVVHVDDAIGRGDVGVGLRSVVVGFKVDAELIGHGLFVSGYGCMGFGYFCQQRALKLLEGCIGFVKMCLLLVEHGVMLGALGRVGLAGHVWVMQRVGMCGIVDSGIIRHDAAPIFRAASGCLAMRKSGCVASSCRGCASASNQEARKSAGASWAKPVERGACKAGGKCVRRFYRVWASAFVCISRRLQGKAGGHSCEARRRLSRRGILKSRKFSSWGPSGFRLEILTTSQPRHSTSAAEFM